MPQLGNGGGVCVPAWCCFLVMGLWGAFVKGNGVRKWGSVFGVKL